MDFLALGQTETLTASPSVAPNLQPPEIQFTVKSSGELKYKGLPNTDIIQELMDKSSYLASSDRQIQKETNRATDRINLLTICFLGSSFLVAIVCCFWSFSFSSTSVPETARTVGTSPPTSYGQGRLGDSINYGEVSNVSQKTYCR